MKKFSLLCILVILLFDMNATVVNATTTTPVTIQDFRLSVYPKKEVYNATLGTNGSTIDKRDSLYANFYLAGLVDRLLNAETYTWRHGDSYYIEYFIKVEETSGFLNSPVAQLKYRMNFSYVSDYEGQAAYVVELQNDVDNGTFISVGDELHRGTTLRTAFEHMVHFYNAELCKVDDIYKVNPNNPKIRITINITESGITHPLLPNGFITTYFLGQGEITETHDYANVSIIHDSSPPLRPTGSDVIVTPKIGAFDVSVIFADNEVVDKVEIHDGGVTTGSGCTSSSVKISDFSQDKSPYEYALLPKIEPSGFGWSKSNISRSAGKHSIGVKVFDKHNNQNVQCKDVCILNSQTCVSHQNISFSPISLTPDTSVTCPGQTIDTTKYYVGQKLVVGGKVLDGTTGVQGAQVIAELETLDVTSTVISTTSIGTTVTGPDGSFRFNVLPASVGTYQIRFKSSYSCQCDAVEASPVVTPPFSVTDPASGHKLDIVSFTLSRETVPLGGNVTLTALVKNNGLSTEDNIPVALEIYLPGNTTTPISRYTETWDSLATNTSAREIKQMLATSTTPGLYEARVSAGPMCYGNGYPKWFRQSHSFYVGTAPAYDEYEQLNVVMPVQIDKGGSPLTVGTGYAVSLITAYSGKAKLRVTKGSWTSGEFIMNVGEWKFLDNNRLIIELIESDTHNYEAWITPYEVSSNLLDISPTILYAKAGATATYRVATNDSDDQPVVDIVYGPDKAIVNSWGRSTSNFSTDETDYDLNINVPVFADLRTYEFWVSVYNHAGNPATGQTGTYIQKLNLMVLPPYSLDIQKSGTGTGTITSLDGSIDCGTTACSGSFTANATVTLLATPDTASTLLGWIGCTPVVNEPLKCMVTMSVDQLVTAIFGKNDPPVVSFTSVPLRFSNQSSGAISFNANENATFECSLDGAAYSSCASPFNYENITNGQHIFSVKAIDSLENSSTTSITWIVNTALAVSSATQLPQTGQSTCWDFSGNPISCAGSGLDGDMRAGIEWDAETRFTDNGDGTITDNLTELIWLKDANCLDSLGGVAKGYWFGALAVGSLEWSDALIWTNALKNGKCGLNDGSSEGQWRLPNRNEMLSLFDQSRFGPALPPGHPFSSFMTFQYWTSSTPSYDDFYAPNSLAWTVHANSGTLQINEKEQGMIAFVLPVRGVTKTIPKTGQTTSYAAGDDGALQMGVQWPNPRFKDNNDGTVADNLTGLVWLKNNNCLDTAGGVPKVYESFPQDDGTQTLSHVLTWTKALAHGICGLTDGSTEGQWRLPNVLELSSLVDIQHYNLSLPSEHPFTQIPSGRHGVDDIYYWSSSRFAQDPLYASSVNMYSGRWDLTNITGLNYTWPVRGGQVNASAACGSADKTTVNTVPTTNLCRIGTASTATPTATGWTWDCNASSGSLAICSATQSFSVITTGSGATGNVDCITPVNKGEPFTCIISPATGYRLATFTDNSLDRMASVIGNSYVINNVAENHTITATFAALPTIAVCGSADKTTITIPPSNNLCLNSSASQITSTTTGWSWTCTNENSISAICFAYLPHSNRNKSIALGFNGVLVLKSDGTVWSSYSGDELFSKVAGLDDVISISTDNSHGLAVKNDGTVWAWGENYQGLLGIGTTEYGESPQRVNEITNVLDVFALDNMSFAVKDDGTFWGWGDNSYGQIVPGGEVVITTPILISGLTGITDIAGDYNQLVALKSDGTLFMWGAGNQPTKYEFLNHVSAITSNGSYIYAQKEDGTIWELNGNWEPTQLGQMNNIAALSSINGSPAVLLNDGNVYKLNGDTFTQITSLTGITTIKGSYYLYAIKNDGTLWRSPGSQNISSPTLLPGHSGYVQIAGGTGFTLGLKNDGTVWSWGNNSYPEQIPGLSGVTELAAGYMHALARKSDGTIWAWGNNDYNQLGDGTTVSKTVPSKIDSLSGVKSIAVGYYSSYAVLNDGSVKAWGYNGYGNLGDGSTISSSTPITVNGLMNITKISAGNYQAFALNDNGAVWGWGGYFISMGDGASTDLLKPSVVNGINNVRSVGVLFNQTYALRQDGSIWWWGHYVNETITPRPVAGIMNQFASLVCNDSTCISITNKGELWAYGNGLPSRISNLSGVISAAVAVDNSLYATRNDSTLWAWSFPWSYGQPGFPLAEATQTRGFTFKTQNPPTITQFSIPASSSSLTVPISFTTSSEVPIQAYCLMQINNPDGCNWQSSVPEQYTFIGPVQKAGTTVQLELNAWVRDNNGVISNTATTRGLLTSGQTFLVGPDNFYNNYNYGCGYIFPQDNQILASGESIQFNIVPCPGSRIENVTVDKQTVAVSNPQAFRYTFTNVTANHQISASFYSESDPNGIITGRVIDASGIGIEGVHVNASGSVGFYGNKTQPDGRYFLRVAPGSYKVMFDGYNTEFIDQWYNNQPTSVNASPVSVNSATETVTINATLVRGGRIAGKVTNEVGMGIKDIHVIACLYNIMDNYCRSIATQADGSFTVSGLKAGDYKVELNPNNNGYIFQFYNNKNYKNPDLVQVSLDSTTQGINAILSLGGTISGRVTNSSGTGIVNAGIAAIDITNGLGIAWASSQEDGTYVLRGIPPGKISLHFHANGFESQYYNNTVDSNATDSLTITNNATFITDINAVLSPFSGINGDCGSANGATVSTAPTANLCNYTTSSPTVTGSGPWNWICTGSGTGTPSYCTANITKFTLTTSTSGTGIGTVSALPASGPYNAGSSVSLTATKTGNSTFTGWSGDCSGIANPYTLTMNAAKNCTATFTSDAISTDGICGNAAGISVTSAPDTNLCTFTSTTPTIIGSGPWSWTCSGTGSGISSTCRAEMTASGTLPSGSNVSVAPIQAVNLNFASVSTPGTVQILSTSPASGNIKVASGAEYLTVSGTSYDISTSASASGLITVCIGYNPVNVTVAENALRLLHHNGIAWEDITTSVDTAANKVCGQTASLSPFVIGILNNTKPGDCDNSGTVTIAEVQSAINMFLGLKPVQTCVDTSFDNNVSIAEVQKVINGFLGL